MVVGELREEGPPGVTHRAAFAAGQDCRALGMGSVN